MVLSDMDINAIRRSNLRRLVDNYDTQVAMARALGISPQVLNGLLTGQKPFGEKSARSLEASLKLAAGWLDRNGGDDERPGLAGLDDATIQIARQIQALTPRDRGVVLDLVRSLRKP